MNKPKVLVFIDWFYPAYKAGGPIRSVSSLTNQLANDFEFFVVTSNQDLGAEIIEVVPNNWVEKEKMRIIYLDESKQNIGYYKKIISETQPSKIYINSLFSRKFSIEPLIAVRRLKQIQNVVLAPRGMLGSGAIQGKRLKKVMFLVLTKLFQFFKGIIWHSTSFSEVEEIRKWFPNSSIKLAKNLVELPIYNQKRISKKEKNKLKLVFFSRISRKKNLLFALDIISTFPSISLDIFGPIEDEDYWNECKQIIFEKEINAEYKGIAKPNELDKILLQYDFFLFPTMHENFGHVIVESLLRGTPVICSDQTYWRNLEIQKAGFDLALDKSGFVNILNQCLEMSQIEHQKFIEGGLALGKKYALDIEEIKNTRNLFLNE